MPISPYLHLYIVYIVWWMSLNVGELQVQQLMALGFSVATWADHTATPPAPLFTPKACVPKSWWWHENMKMIEPDILIYLYIRKSGRAKSIGPGMQYALDYIYRNGITTSVWEILPHVSIWEAVAARHGLSMAERLRRAALAVLQMKRCFNPFRTYDFPLLFAQKPETSWNDQRFALAQVSQILCLFLLCTSITWSFVFFWAQACMWWWHPRSQRLAARRLM